MADVLGELVVVSKLNLVGLVVLFFGSCFMVLRADSDEVLHEIGNAELKAAISESLGSWISPDYSTNKRCNFTCPMRMKL